MVTFEAKLENIGAENATNVTFTIDIPSEWTVTFGSTSYFFSSFDSGDSYTNLIEVTIPDNASTGL